MDIQQYTYIMQYIYLICISIVHEDASGSYQNRIESLHKVTAVKILKLRRLGIKYAYTYHIN